MTSVLHHLDYKFGDDQWGRCAKRTCTRLGDEFVSAQSSLGGLVRVFLCDRCADELKPRENAAQGVMFKEDGND